MRSVLRIVLLGWPIPIFVPLIILLAWLLDVEKPLEAGGYLAIVFARGDKAATAWMNKRIAAEGETS